MITKRIVGSLQIVRGYLRNSRIAINPKFSSFISPSYSETHPSKLTRSFAKKSKKEIEKEEKTKMKSEHEIPDQIDIQAIDQEFKDAATKVTQTIGKMKFGVLQPEMIGNIKIHAYGDSEATPLSELSQIILKNDTTAQVNIYDQSLIDNIRKEIESSPLNFNIRKEGTSIIISLAGANSKQAKAEFIKEVKAIATRETERLKNLRGDKMNELKGYKELLPKDVLFNAEKQIQEIYLKYTKQITDTTNQKCNQLGA